MGLLLKLKSGDTALKSLRYGNDRPGGGDSGQPFIKSKIPDESKPPRPLDIDGFIRGGLDAPKAAETDSKRLSNYLVKNPNGLLFVAKQNVLSRVAPKTETSFGAGYGGSKKSLIQDSVKKSIGGNGALLTSGEFRKGPAGVNGGIYTPLSTIGQARVGYLGTHLNKQGLDPTGVFPAASINKYQEVAFENNRLVNNAHKPDIPVTLLKKQKRLERRENRKLDREYKLEDKLLRAENDYRSAFDDLTVISNTPARTHVLKQKPVYFRPNFQSRQLQKLGVTGQMVANTNNPVPAGSYPIVPSGNPNNVQGITFSQQGPTGRYKNVTYNKLQKRKKEILDQMSQVWRNIQVYTAGKRFDRKSKKVGRIENKLEGTRTRLARNRDRQIANQAEIDTIAEGDLVYENRLLKLWNKTGININAPVPFYQGPVLFSYGGGPGSALGIGQTQIKFATLNDGITPYRTGTNSRRYQQDEPGYFGQMDPKEITDKQYNWKQILRNSATYQYINLKDDNGDLLYNKENYDYYEFFDPSSRYNWWDNYIIQGNETANINQFMPWAYDRTLVNPKNWKRQQTIDQDYDDKKIHESLYTFNIRKLGNAGTNINRGGKVNKVNAYKVQNQDEYEASKVATLRTGSIPELGDLVQFTIALQPGDKTSGKEFLQFPAFIDSYSEDFSADYKTIQYMGRPEPFYKYSGFKRGISLSFTVVAQSRNEIGNMYAKLNYLASSIAPSYTDAGYMTGNLAYLTVGDICNDKPGIIEGFTFDIPEESSWDIGLYQDGNDINGNPIVKGDGAQMAMMIKVSGFKFTPLYDQKPEWGTGIWFGDKKIIETEGGTFSPRGTSDAFLSVGDYYKKESEEQRKKDEQLLADAGVSSFNELQTDDEYDEFLSSEFGI